MVTLNINIPDAQASRVVDAVATAYGYQATLPDGNPNPQTKNQFAKERIIEFLKDLVIQHESALAAESARQAAIASVEQQLTLS